MKLTLDRVTLRPVSLLLFSLAGTAAVFSACATVVEEDPATADDGAGPITSNVSNGGNSDTTGNNTAGNGIGNTTTISNTVNTVSTASTSSNTSNTTSTSSTASTDGALGGTVTMTVATVSTVTTVSTATSTSTTGSGGAGNTGSTGIGSMTGAGGMTMTSFGNMSSMSATTGGTGMCTAKPWVAGESPTGNGPVFPKGSELSYMGNVYTADVDINDANAGCPPGDEADWCAASGYSYTLVGPC